MQKTHNATSVRYNAAIAAFNALKLRYADATRRENGIIKAGKKLHTLSARSPHPQSHWRTRLASLFRADKKREKMVTFWVHSNARTHDAHMREGEQQRSRSDAPQRTRTHPNAPQHTRQSMATGRRMWKKCSIPQRQQAQGIPFDGCGKNPPKSAQK